MVRKTFVAGATSVALMMGLSAASVSAVAETRAKAADIDTITVVAPRMKVERMPTGVSKVITVEKDAHVGYSDLDLRRVADLRSLEARIEEAATLLCQDLAEQLPHGQPRMSVCVRRAVEDAREQLNEATQFALAH